MPYHMQATPTPRRCEPVVTRRCMRVAPVRAQGFKTLGKPGAGMQHLAGRCRIAGANGILPAEFQPVLPHLVGQHVHQRFMRDRRLGHAEAAEGAGRRIVGVNGARCRRHMRHEVRACRVHRHAVGDRRPPARHRRRYRNRHVNSMARSRPDASAAILRARMREGWRLVDDHHRFGPRIDAAYRRG